MPVLQLHVTVRKIPAPYEGLDPLLLWGSHLPFSFSLAVFSSPLLFPSSSPLLPSRLLSSALISFPPLLSACLPLLLTHSDLSPPPLGQFRVITPPHNTHTHTGLPGLRGSLRLTLSLRRFSAGHHECHKQAAPTHHPSWTQARPGQARPVS